MIKTFVSEAFGRVMDRAVQIFGAAGIAMDLPIAAVVRRRARRADLRRRQRGAPHGHRARAAQARDAGRVDEGRLRGPRLSLHAIAPDDIVAHLRGGRGQRAPAAARHRPAARRSSTSTGSARASSTIEPVGEGHSNVTYVVRRGDAEVVMRRPPRAAAAAQRARRAARGARAARDRRARRACREVLAVVRRRVGHRRAVLRDGAGRRATSSPTAIPAALDTRRGARAHRRGARRRARRGPRRRLAGRRAGGLRQADRLPRAPAAALHRAVGAQQARARSRRSSASARGCATNLPESAAGDDRARRLPPRQHDVRARRRRRGSSRSSTGRWRRSATRSPTSATCARCGSTATTRRSGMFELPRSRASEGFPHARRAGRAATRSARAAR